MLSCAMDAKEGRYVIVTDIPGAFLHADMEDEIHMLLESTIAKLIVKLELSLYRKHIWYNKKGKPMLYVKLKKALSVTLLSTSRDKVLDYLGMKIDYHKKGKVTFSMEDCIMKLLDEAPYDMYGITKTPAGLHLFNIDDGATKLSEEKVQHFHHIMAKLLYLCRRQDIQTVLAFLCTRVKSLDEDDYKNLGQVLQYLRGTKETTLTIEPSNNPCWWVDSSYTMHPDMKSHTGIFMSIGKGSAYSSSCKQKINTKSSMEAELVGIDDAMGRTLWKRHFLVAQGVTVPTTTINQDNECTIQLEENGKANVQNI